MRKRFLARVTFPTKHARHVDLRFTTWLYTHTHVQRLQSVELRRCPVPHRTAHAYFLDHPQRGCECAHELRRCVFCLNSARYANHEAWGSGLGADNIVVATPHDIIVQPMLHTTQRHVPSALDCRVWVRVLVPALCPLGAVRSVGILNIPFFPYKLWGTGQVLGY